MAPSPPCARALCPVLKPLVRIAAYMFPLDTSTGSSSTTGSFGSLIFLLIVMVPLLLMVFGQRRRAKAAQAMNRALVLGDDVMTTSGLYGRIVVLDDVTAVLEVSPGVRLKFARAALAGKAAPGLATNPGSTPHGDLG